MSTLRSPTQSEYKPQASLNAESKEVIIADEYTTSGLDSKVTSTNSMKPQYKN